MLRRCSRHAIYRICGDWSEKPNAVAYKSLVLEQWRTCIEEPTAANGTFKAPGFFGEYRVTVDSDGRHSETTLTFTMDQSATVVVKRQEVGDGLSSAGILPAPFRSRAGSLRY